MQTLRYKSKGKTVYLLEELLYKIGYTDVIINEYFGLDTHTIIKDYQSKNQLVVDGIVGPKTWSSLLKKEHEFLIQNDKFLSEDDLIQFAEKYKIELAVVKAINALESKGKGFLIDGRPRILFEGHIFWKELKNREIDPQSFVSNHTHNILYPKWTKKYYVGGSKEYFRLEKAAGLSDSQEVHDAAFSAASWGSFQIMGFHAKDLGYQSVDHFVSKMYEHEREHLKALGLFLEKNNLIKPLQKKDWKTFARGYNGVSYAKNNYHVKLEKTYNQIKNT